MGFGWKRVALATVTANACALAAASVAAAHVGGPATGGFAAGFAHPFLGLDHLAAMLAIGAWAWQQGGRAVYVVPATFVAVMAVGAALGQSDFALPMTELGIAGSVVVLGLLVATAVRIPLVAAVAATGVFALVHGHAHGTEMPAGAAAGAYAAGFVSATLALHAIGIALASRLRLRRRARALATSRTRR